MKEQLSKNFNLHELLVSDSYPELAAAMVVTEPIYNNLLELTTTILQPVRDFLDEPIRVQSGLRLEPLNSKVGGTDDSDHKFGMAGDITSKKIRADLEGISRKIWALGLPIRQLIYYPDDGFIHISMNSSEKPFKHAFMVKYNGKPYQNVMV